MGPFLAKITLKDGYGFWGLSGTPLSNSNLSTPPGVRDTVLYSVHSFLLPWQSTKLLNFNRNFELSYEIILHQPRQTMLICLYMQQFYFFSLPLSDAENQFITSKFPELRNQGANDVYIGISGRHRQTRGRFH